MRALVDAARGRRRHATSTPSRWRSARLADEQRTARTIRWARMQLAEAAVQLAPNLPCAHLALARDATSPRPGRRRPAGSRAPARRLRALFAGPALPAARAGEPGRRGCCSRSWPPATRSCCCCSSCAAPRYFLHDFHHLFPRAPRRWQSVALALAAARAAVRAAARAGRRVLLALFAAVVLYLTTARARRGARCCSRCSGLLPLAAGASSPSATAFAGTVAEDVYLLERGGLARAERRRPGARADDAQDAAGFAELFALGPLPGAPREARGRGRALQARRGAAQRGAPPAHQPGQRAARARGHPRAPAALPGRARGRTPRSPRRLYNLAQRALPPRRGAAGRRGGGGAGPREHRAQRRAAPGPRAARARTRPRSRRADEPPAAQPARCRRRSWPRWPTLRGAASAVQAQLERLLLGGGAVGPAAWALPGRSPGCSCCVGLSRGPAAVSRPRCEKCGRAVCRRCDRELRRAQRSMCGQCVNAFAPQGRGRPAGARAQAARGGPPPHADGSGSRWRFGALLLAAPATCSAACPCAARSTPSSSCFLLSGVLLREGLVRAPYGEVPVSLSWSPCCCCSCAPLTCCRCAALSAARPSQAGAMALQGNAQGLRHRRHPPAHRPAAEDRHAAPAGARSRRSRSASRTAASSRAESTTRKKKELIGNMLVRAELITEAQLERRAGDAAPHPQAAGRRARLRADASPTSASGRWCSCRPPRRSTASSAGRTGTYEFEQGEVEATREAITPLRAESVLMEGFRMVDEWPVIKQDHHPLRRSTFERLKALPPPARPSRGRGLRRRARRRLRRGEEGREQGRVHVASASNERQRLRARRSRAATSASSSTSRCLGEFETCKALCNLVNLGYLRAITPRASRPRWAAAAERPARRRRMRGARRRQHGGARGARLRRLAR